MRALEIRDLISSGLFGYGSSMSKEEFGNLANIEKPDISNMRGEEVIVENNKYTLQLLSLYDQVNNQLLPIGRKLVSQDERYVVPDIANTLTYVAKYEKESKAKIAKARKLQRGFIASNPTFEIDEGLRTSAAASRSRVNQLQNAYGPAS